MTRILLTLRKRRRRKKKEKKKKKKRAFPLAKHKSTAIKFWTLRDDLMLLLSKIRKSI